MNHKGIINSITSKGTTKARPTGSNIMLREKVIIIKLTICATLSP